MSVHAIDATGGMLLGQRFRLIDLLGEGAMGAVWRATDEQTGVVVAVKLLHPHMANDSGLAARFEREIAAGRRLDHPNLVRAIAAGTESCGRYMVMSLLAGHDLRSELGEGIGVRRTVAVTRQILSALEHVHGIGLIHRDVKPENLRLVPEHDADDRVVLMDFGLVRSSGVQSEERPLTQHGRVFGTPWYMAPEQAAGAAIDHRVDLYATGAVMFEMLTGKPPFDGTLVAVLHHHMYTETPSLPTWVPRELAELVARLLAKHPDDRPESASEALRMLDAAIARVASRPTLFTASVHDEPAFVLGTAFESFGAGERPAAILHRNRFGGRLTAALVAAAAAVAVWFVVDRADVDAPPAIANEQTITEPAPVAPIATNTIPVAPAPTPVVTPVVPAPVVAPVVIPDLEVPTTTPVIVAVDDKPVVDPPRGAGVERPDPPRSLPPRTQPPRTQPPCTQPPRTLPPPPTDTPPRTLKSSKPPRNTQKVPGLATQPARRNADGTIKIGPRTS